MTTREYEKRPDNCRGCNAQLRPRQNTDLPGKPHAGNGYCNGCRAAYRRGQQPKPPTPHHQCNVRGLANYIARRRDRGVPAEGARHGIPIRQYIRYLEAKGAA